MKVTIAKDVLVSGLRKVLSVVPPRSALPILNNLLLEVDGSTLSLTTTDLEVCMHSRIPALVEEAGATTLPARKFGQIIGALPDGDVVLETSVDEQTHITCGRTNFRVLGLNAGEFPRDHDIDDAVSLNMNGGEFCRNLNKVSYAISTDDKRPVLTGILLSIRDGIITFAGTDGRRLALLEKSVFEGNVADTDVILPPKVVSELVKIGAASERDMRIELTENRARFSIGDTILTTRLIEGMYVNYRQVVPAGFSHTAVMPRTMLATVLNRVGMVVSESSASIRLALSTGTATIKAASAEFGEASEPMEVSYEGEPIELSFNPVFLSDPLKHLEADTVILQFNDEISPVTVAGDEGFLYVIMPLRT